MSTSKEVKKRIQYQGKDKKKWLIAMSLIGTATIMTGTGIGIGYAI
jgi:hypothetical protein